MKTSFLISQKVDENTHFVFLKRPKKFLIVENFYLDLFAKYDILSKSEFVDYLSEKHVHAKPDVIYSDLNELFKEPSHLQKETQNNYVIPKKLYKFKFKLGDNCYTINYEDQRIIKDVIGQLKHLEDNSINESKNYYVFKNDDNFILKDDYNYHGVWKKDDLHYLTGKILSFFICDFHKILEKKWSGFLHATTVSKNNKAFLIIGESGDGKSTSSAILCKNGYSLMVDDISPINRKGEVASFPNAISVKNSSFEKLKNLYDSNKFSSTIQSNKGEIKYLNPSGLKKFDPNSKSCYDIIKLKYDVNNQNSLKRVKLKELLPLIVNESYFPTSVKSVRSFMNWLLSCNYYSLNYCDDKMLIKFFEKI